MTVTVIIALEFTYWLYRLKLVGLPETIGLALLIAAAYVFDAFRERRK